MRLQLLRLVMPGLPTGDFGWGSPIFAKAQRKKVRLIAMFLKLGVQVGRRAVRWLTSSTGPGQGGNQEEAGLLLSPAPSHPRHRHNLPTIAQTQMWKRGYIT
jgi:hypothetical protein